MKERFLIGLLLAAVVLAYGNTLANQFTMDDGLYIEQNPQVTAPSMHGLFSPNRFSNVFRPVAFASLALNWAFGGDQPAGYHLFNLMLHAGVTWLLYLLLQEILGDSAEGKTVSFVTAMLFAVHPIHTEAVASAVGRAELLAAGFLLAAWICHLRDRPIASVFWFVLALLSKESAVAFFPLVLIGDYATNKWKPRPRYALLAGITAVYLGALWIVQGGRFGQPRISLLDNPLASLPAGWRILNAIHVAWKYAGLQIYPAVLSCDYSFNQIPVYRDWVHTFPGALAAAAALGLWILAIWKRQSSWVLAGGIYLAGFATTANILVPTGTIMGERLAYFPSAGFCLLLALGWIWVKDRQKYVAWALFAIVIVTFGARAASRNRDWHDNFALYSAAVRATPASAKMHSNLGVQYMHRNRLDLAGAQFKIALWIDPDYPDALSSYGALELSSGNYQAAGALLEKAFNLSARDNPNYDFIAVNFAAVLAQTNHVDAGLDLLNREISESPGYAPAWAARAMIHYKRREIELARADAETALQLNPEDIQTLNLMPNLGASEPAGSPR
jgi:tetratricopeptide (TPR) repeat protein